MTYAILSSDRTNITDTVTIDVDPELPHNFAGIIFYDANGNEINISGGSVTIEGRHLTNNKFETVVDGVISSSNDAAEGQWSGNVTQVRATPTGLAGTNLATYQLVVVQNGG